MSTSLYASVIARGRGRQTISQPLKQTTMRPPSVQYLAKMMRSRVLYKYLALGMGVASMGYYGYSKYCTSTGNRNDNLKLLLVSVFAAGVGYVGARYIQVAHCESPPAKMDKLDQALFDAHVKANEVQAYAQKKADEALDDLKKHVDEKAEELWELTKDKYISKAMIEAFELIVKIFDNFKDFSQYNDVHFRTPLPLLLGLIMTAQHKVSREWIESLPETETIEVDESKFMLHKRIGEFAIQVYDASMASTKALQASAFGLESEEDLLYTWFSDDFDSDHCPKFAVLLDHNTRFSSPSRNEPLRLD
jgi:hypothetical protein